MSVRVWAPRAHRLALERDAGSTPMRRVEGGWWQADAALAHGEDYAFRVDGEGPFPDPRSPWQPQGVHGRSRHVDHARFVWHDAGWHAPPLREALIYELHVGTFTPDGTFDGVITRLDHLIDLGVSHVELMPVAAFPGRHGWGYDGVDLYAPHAPYGGPEGLKRLVDACHARGLAVLLDVVYNHLGPDGNHLARFGPYFTGRYRTPWGEAINFDGPHSDTVRRFFVDNALHWLEHYHVDGLRLDAVHAILDTSAYPFLEQLADEVRALSRRLDRPLALIAESDLNDPRLVRDPERGGFGMDAQWNEDFHHALHAALTGERSGYYVDFGRLDDVATALTRHFVYDGRHSVYRQRAHGRRADDVPAQRFVACLQNHDQVGNRAQGDRIGGRLTPGLRKIGAALVLTAPAVPMLFQGEEWNASAPFQYFTDHQDAALATAVREGRRREFAAFGWDPQAIPDPQDPGSFRRSVLDWTETGGAGHADLLAWYKRLVVLRRAHPALGAGTPVAVRCDERARWLWCERGDCDVACNLAAHEQVLPADGGDRELLAASSDGCRVGVDGVHLAAESVAILRRRNA